jgi:hypothetical protein
MTRGMLRAGVAALWAVALGAPAFGAPALAQGQAADPEAHIVEELVVQAREPGPAWWRVSDRGATVYILAVPDGPIPPGVAWDHTILERRLKGANAVVGPPGFQAGLRDIPAVFRLRAQLKSRGPMEAGLPPTLAARFAADLRAAGKPAGRYSDWQPLAAGAFFMRETHQGWTSLEPQVRRLARRQGLRETSSARFAAMPLAQAAMKTLTPGEQQACLAWALDDIEAGEARTRRATEAWARGDVAVALTAPRGFDRCLLVLTGGAELWNAISQDEANDIAAALKTPGHAIAVVGLRRLLAQDGVIARLEAKGLHVTGPGEPALP